METIPYRACKDIENSADIGGRIAVVERGDCMFIDKVRSRRMFFTVLIVWKNMVEDNNYSGGDQ